MSKPAAVIYDFVMRRVVDCAPKERIIIYNSLAEIVGSEKQARELKALADECRAIERHHAQLSLQIHLDTEA